MCREKKHENSLRSSLKILGEVRPKGVNCHLNDATRSTILNELLRSACDNYGKTFFFKILREFEEGSDLDLACYQEENELRSSEEMLQIHARLIKLMSPDKALLLHAGRTVIDVAAASKGGFKVRALCRLIPCIVVKGHQRAI